MRLGINLVAATLMEMVANGPRPESSVKSRH